MTPCATIENCRDNKHQYLCIFMSVPASCSYSNSFPLPKAGKNPSIWILSCVWVTIIWIACLLAKGFCPLPAMKPKEIVVHMETWQNGTPSKLHPFAADITLGYVTRGVCWLLSFRSWVVLPPAQSGWKSSGCGPFYKFLCCSAAQEQMWSCDAGMGMMTQLWSSLENPQQLC